MIVKSLSAMIAVFLLCSVASAQSYSIRVTNNTNLRATFSTRSRIVETVPAGTTLQVVSAFNRWLQINRNGNDVWMADWVAYTRVEGGQQTQSQTQTSSQIDNCCFVDRQCNTDQEWTDGYWAFQNNQCVAPTQVRSSTSSQPASSEPSQVNNCCFVGWVCNTDAEWSAGFHAFQQNRCTHTWVEIIGPPHFLSQVQSTLDRIESGAPHWYQYAASSGLRRIEYTADGGFGGFADRTMTMYSSGINDNPMYFLSAIVHETCHAAMWTAGLAVQGWRNEAPCVQAQIDVISTIDPRDGNLWGLRHLMANIENPEYWWWTD